jgi:hypothetical protein
MWELIFSLPYPCTKPYRIPYGWEKNITYGTNLEMRA